MLLETGADKNIKNNNGKTPAQLANDKGEIQIVNLIDMKF